MIIDYSNIKNCINCYNDLRFNIYCCNMIYLPFAYGNNIGCEIGKFYLTSDKDGLYLINCSIGSKNKIKSVITDSAELLLIFAAMREKLLILV